MCFISSRSSVASGDSGAAYTCGDNKILVAVSNGAQRYFGPNKLCYATNLAHPNVQKWLKEI
jgi:hypothetical protein